MRKEINEPYKPAILAKRNTGFDEFRLFHRNERITKESDSEPLAEVQLSRHLEPLAEVERALLVVEVLEAPDPKLLGLSVGDSLEHFDVWIGIR